MRKTFLKYRIRIRKRRSKGIIIKEGNLVGINIKRIKANSDIELTG